MPPSLCVCSSWRVHCGVLACFTAHFAKPIFTFPHAHSTVSPAGHDVFEDTLEAGLVWRYEKGPLGGRRGVVLLSMRLPSLVCLTLPSLFSTPFFSHRVKQVFSSPLVGMQCLGAPFHPMGSAGRGGYSMPSYLFFCPKIGWKSALFPISATLREKSK